MARKVTGGRKKKSKNKSGKTFEEPAEVKKAPHTFIIHRGLSCPFIVALSRDFRKMMEPFTAANLQERKSNRIRDFVSLAGIFHISHMALFTRSSKSATMKISRMPQGPTLTFKIHSFILAKDVVSSLKRQKVEEAAFRHAPLVILNSFSGEGLHMKMMAQTFQNMFPSLNLSNVKLHTVRRCVLFSYSPVTNTIDMRHYAVTLVPTGISKGIKKLTQKKVPDMSKFEDISDLVTKSQALSDSEFEDDEANVELAQSLSRGNVESGSSAVRLIELGPRITFELKKIESELLTGEVLYHKDVKKSAEEILKIKKRRIEKKVQKEQRKKIQAANVSKKAASKEHIKEINGRRFIVTEKDKRAIKETIENDRGALDDDDDAEYYEDELGVKPERELFENATGQAAKNPRKRFKQKKQVPKSKKAKLA